MVTFANLLLGGAILFSPIVIYGHYQVGVPGLGWALAAFMLFIGFTSRWYTGQQYGGPPSRPTRMRTEPDDPFAGAHDAAAPAEVDGAEWGAYDIPADDVSAPVDSVPSQDPGSLVFA